MGTQREAARLNHVMNGRSWDGVGLEKINMPEAMARHYVPKVRAREEGVIYGSDCAEPGFVSKLLPRSKSCCPFNKSQYKSPVVPKALTQKVYGTLPNLNSNPAVSMALHGRRGPTVKVVPYRPSKVVPVVKHILDTQNTVKQGRRAGMITVNGQFKVPQRAPVIEEATGRQSGSASATGFHHYDYQREARTAVARRMEVEAQAAAVSEENAARAAREQQQNFHPEAEISGLATFPGHFARAPGPEAAPWVTREGAGEQHQQVTRYSAEPTFGQTWIQSLPKGVKVSQKETVSQKLVRPPRPQELRCQRACGSWPRRAS